MQARKLAIGNALSEWDASWGRYAEDLPLLFELWADPVAIRMAAFTAPEHMDRHAFERCWSRLRADKTVLTKVIVVDGDVAGTIGSWGDCRDREVTFWIGRSYWGKGSPATPLMPS